MPILHSFEENKLEYEDEDEVEIKMMGTGMDKESLEHNLHKNDITPCICHNFPLTSNPPIKPKDSGSFRMKVVKPLTIHTPPSPHVAYFHQNGVLYLMRRSLEVLRKFHWMILGGRFNQLSHVSFPLLSKPEECKAHLLEDKQIPSVGVFDEVFSIWKAFGGNTRDLGSFGEETNKTTDLHQNPLKIMLTEPGDGVTSIKRRRHDLRGDGVSTLVTPSEHGRPKGTLEDSVRCEKDAMAVEALTHRRNVTTSLLEVPKTKKPSMPTKVIEEEDIEETTTSGLTYDLPVNPNAKTTIINDDSKDEGDEAEKEAEPIPSKQTKLDPPPLKAYKPKIPYP
ncbi:hypothetical protein Tco_1090436 [Tanacetum coccineum]|uniref:Uncharacterized protein n=1 Tax=Tanacetum coccineum TaxID=301880 RepID=A0ABQ5I4B8_9ASTR